MTPYRVLTPQLDPVGSFTAGVPPLSVTGLDAPTESIRTGSVGLSYLHEVPHVAGAPGVNAQQLSRKRVPQADGGTGGYCPGTLIQTTAGDVPVERLAIGDLVVTLDGKAEPIRWLGRRSYSVRILRPAHRPIVFRLGALGDAVPKRSLRVSPHHAMLMGGILVPAFALVNGSTIVRDKECRRVDYIHIEMAEHGVIWAEGAASETFVDDDSRSLFQNANQHAELYPGGVKASACCAPRVTGGYLLEVIRRGLAQRTIAMSGSSERPLY